MASRRSRGQSLITLQLCRSRYQISMAARRSITYVNSQKQNNTTLGRIMHDFYCKDAKDVKNKTLKNRIKFFKEDKEGVTIMANTIDKFRLECEIAGMKKQSIETARKMIKAGRFSNAEIADFANLTEVDVESLKEDKNLKIAQN